MTKLDKPVLKELDVIRSESRHTSVYEVYAFNNLREAIDVKSDKRTCCSDRIAVTRRQGNVWICRPDAVSAECMTEPLGVGRTAKDAIKSFIGRMKPETRQVYGLRTNVAVNMPDAFSLAPKFM